MRQPEVSTENGGHQICPNGVKQTNEVTSDQAGRDSLADPEGGQKRKRPARNGTFYKG